MSAADRPYGAFSEVVLDDLYRQLSSLQKHHAAVLADCATYDTDNPEDWAAHDAAAGDADELSDELADIENRIFALEDDAARAELRELRSGYYSSI